MLPIYSNLDEVISTFSIHTVFIATILLFVLTLISLNIKHLGANLKKTLFITICLVTVLATAILSGATIYLNNISSSKGPVHWHADFEIWWCGKEMNLPDPKGFSNKIGIPTLHEHNDKRIHLEGVVVKPEDASLGKFFHVIGGNLESERLTIPINDGQATLSGGSLCDNGKVTQLQVFVYKVTGKKYTQLKLNNPAEYIISPQSQVPPGDCIIIEMDEQKDKTDKLCRSFAVAKQIGKLE